MSSSQCNYSTSKLKTLVGSKIPLSSADFAWQTDAIASFAEFCEENKSFYADSPGRCRPRRTRLDTIELSEHGYSAVRGLSAHSSIDALCSTCGHHWVFPGRCSDARLCPMCGAADRRRYHKHWESILTGKKQVLKKGVVCSIAMRNPKFLTLTVPSESRLLPQVKFLKTTFKLLRRTFFVKNHVRGGLAVLETTFNEGAGWHSHLHVLIDSPFIPVEEITKEWSRLTGASHWSQKIKRVDTAEGLHYVTEYIGKPPVYRSVNGVRDELPPSLCEEYRTAMLGVRLIWGFGAFYNAPFHVKDPLSCSECGSLDVGLFHHGIDTVCLLNSSGFSFDSYYSATQGTPMPVWLGGSP